ncbi:formyltetrahydrofolate deformylase [Nocardia sp. CA-151230]|uniref:formyltetrahydrofolate deformylase n=1 Tax=Nocardia sp. CA-151230 TaxID=3239982 RepID=UPI003D8AA222
MSGNDRPGIVSAVSNILTGHGANIVSLDQYSTDPEGGRFFQRAVFHLDHLAQQRTALEVDLRGALTGRFGLQWSLIDAAAPKRAALFVSKLDHCLLELLSRHRHGELPMDVVTVVSNHTDLAWVSDAFDVSFRHIPVEKDRKWQAEAEQLALLEGKVDVVVLARYMQVLSGDFLAAVGVPVINIHHSFLPAFVGAAPYRKAKERGVKLVGATAHFVTEDLDEGPIIEQDVVRISHTDSAEELVRRGAYVERLVLSRAVEAFCEDRIMRDGSTTVVF